MIGRGILVFAVVIAVLTLLFRWATMLMGKSFGQIVHRRHTDVEFILHTRTPPPGWQRRRGGRPRSRAAILRDLRVLTGYFRNAPVFETERERVVMMRSLEQIKSEWKNKPREELVDAR